MITCVEDFERENEYERRHNDIRWNTISYARKKDITSREGKVERKKRCEGNACNTSTDQMYLFIVRKREHTLQYVHYIKITTKYCVLHPFRITIDQ